MALILVEDPVEGAAGVHTGIPVCVPDIPRGSLRGAADPAGAADALVWEDVHRYAVL